MRFGAKIRDPKIRPVVEELAGMIDGGKWTAGERLPPMRQLADRYAISFNAARQAVGRLEDMGLVRCLKGSGTYVRDLRASNPVTGTLPIACLFMDSRTAIFGDLFHNVSEGLNRQRLVTIKAFSNVRGEDPREDPQLDHVLDYLRKNPPRAIVLQGHDEWLEKEILLSAPAGTRVVGVFRHPQFDIPGWHSVNADVRSAFRMAAEYLIKHGHKRIGLVTKPRMIKPKWKHTFRKAWMWHTEHILAVGHALRDAGIDHGLAIHYTQELNALSEADITRIAAWLSRADRPTAVIAEDFRIDDIRRAAQLAGLRCPGELELVSVGGRQAGLPGDTPHVSLQYDLLARHIVDLVMVEDDRLQGAVRHIMVPPVFVRHRSQPESNAEQLSSISFT